MKQGEKAKKLLPEGYFQELGLFVELIGSGKIKTVKNFVCVTVNCCMQEYISV